MQSPELRLLTASEPLTLEEEYDMQEKWRVDEDKLTFIILSRFSTDGSALTSNEVDKGSIESLPMVGDVNLFIVDNEDEKEVEVEIMIAEPAYRRLGLARSAISAILHYAIGNITIGASHSKVETSHLLTRVGQSNHASIALFQRLGFSIAKEANVFGEIEMRALGETQEVLAKWDPEGIAMDFP
ncbi:hypothetical protein CPB86DRAFT_782267 [Serendipita vermifera]|nr:hypothetical protein CPB86DRAFT_782267 [Serendipita vermifera]